MRELTDRTPKDLLDTRGALHVNYESNSTVLKLAGEIYNNSTKYGIENGESPHQVDGAMDFLQLKAVEQEQAKITDSMTRGITIQNMGDFAFLAKIGELANRHVTEHISRTDSHTSAREAYGKGYLLAKAAFESSDNTCKDASEYMLRLDYQIPTEIV